MEDNTSSKDKVKNLRCGEFAKMKQEKQ